MKQEGLAAQFRSQVYDQAAKKPSVVSDKPAKMFYIIHDQNAKKSVSMYDQPVIESLYTQHRFWILTLRNGVRTIQSYDADKLNWLLEYWKIELIVRILYWKGREGH